MEERPSVYPYSEIFYSAQGEGRYTGCPTAWLRFFSCNLQCDGFGQEDPTDPDTYELPYQDINVDGYKTLEELPVFAKGCDSSYSWSKKFKHLQRSGTPDEIAQRLLNGIPDEDFRQKEGLSRQDIHLCFTGGEPLMKKSHKAVR